MSDVTVNNPDEGDVNVTVPPADQPAEETVEPAAEPDGANTEDA